MGHDQPTTISGHTFLRATEPGQVRELNNRVTLALDADGCRWLIGALTSGRSPEQIDSQSLEVIRHLRRVIAAMKRTNVTRPIRPVPKPEGKRRGKVRSAPVPTPPNDEWE